MRMSQLTFLQREWAAVFEAASKDEAAVDAGPRTACSTLAARRSRVPGLLDRRSGLRLEVTPLGRLQRQTCNYG